MEEKTQEEKPKKFNKMLVFAFVLYVGIALSAVASVMVTQKNNEEKWEHENNREVVDALVESDVYQYAQYFTIDRDKLEEQPVLSQTLCTYTSEQQNKADENNVPTPCVTWYWLQKAKFDFHNKTTKSRMLATDKVIVALENVENGFDQVFEEIISEEWYSRSQSEHYNEVMPPLFTELEDVLRGELK